VKRPFVYIFFSLFSGIVLTYIFNIRINYFIATCIMIAFSMMLLKSTKYDMFIVVVIFVVLGNLLFNIALTYESILEANRLNNPIEVLILNDGLDRGNYTSYIEYEAKVLLTEEKSLIRLFNQTEDAFNVGDVVELTNYKSKGIDLHNEKHDGYLLYLKSRGIKNIVDINWTNIKYVKTNSKSLRAISFKIRRYIERYLDDSFHDSEKDLLKSIIFGNRGYMSKEMVSHFSRSGTAHIIAVSGLHIGLIVIFFERVMKLFKIRKKQIKILTALTLLIYAYAVNFPVSIVRAIIMYYLYIAAYLLERKYDAINSLLFLATILLIINPFIIFSVSFQLSFSATLGILILFPLIYSFFKVYIFKSLNSLLSVTLAAQLATLPILVYHFNYLSTISIIANLLIIPVMGLLISLTIGSIILGIISVNLAMFFNSIINL